MKKLHLAALRHLFDVAVKRHVVMLNPALSVRGPKLQVREGKTKGLGVTRTTKLYDQRELGVTRNIVERIGF